MQKTSTLLLLAVAGYGHAAPLASALVEYKTVALTYSTDGVVEAVKQSTVAAQVAGRITELKWRAGDQVAKGAVIARIDATQVEQGLAASLAQQEEARAQLEHARSQLERNRQLHAQKFISQSALDAAQTAFTAAEAHWRAVQAGAGQAAATRSYATVLAPYSGVVAAVHAEVGEMATLGKPLLTAFDPASLRLVSSLPQSKLAAVRNGGQASVELEEGRWLPPLPVTVLPVADARSNTIDVRIALPAGIRGLTPGQYGKVHFTIGQARKLVLPASSILRRSELTAVYALIGQQPQLRQVRLGEPAGAAGQEVLAGVKAGERVALDPVAAGMAAAAPLTK